MWCVGNIMDGREKRLIQKMSRVHHKRHSIQVHPPLAPAHADHQTTHSCRNEVAAGSSYHICLLQDWVTGPLQSPWARPANATQVPCPSGRGSPHLPTVGQTVLNLEALVWNGENVQEGWALRTLCSVKEASPKDKGQWLIPLTGGA